MNSINDWAEYLLWAEKNMKDLEKKILNKTWENMEELQKHASAIKSSIDQTLIWADINRPTKAKQEKK